MSSVAIAHERNILHILTDIPHMPSKFVEIVLPFPRQGNCILFAAIRWPDFGDRPALGRPFGHFSRHPDTPLPSFLPRSEVPRPTPERVFVAIHRSAAGFPETGSGAQRLPPSGTWRSDHSFLRRHRELPLIAISGSQDDAAERPLHPQQPTFEPRCPLANEV